MDRQSLEPGLMLFIKRKLENAVPLREVTEMLMRAGFSERQITEAVQEVHNRFPDTHQDIVAGNGFLPPLKKTAEKENARPVVKEPEKKSKPRKSIQLSLFKGRLRRRDFIFIFMFYFGFAIVLLSTVFNMLAIFLPRFIPVVQRLAQHNEHGLLLLILPALVAPISFILISVIGRRFHDLGLPAWISFGYLIFFVDPFSNIFSMEGVVALQAAMVILFILMVTLRGDMGDNKYGSKPALRGSLFTRVFNVVV